MLKRTFRFIPQVEQLEDRFCLSVSLTVDSIVNASKMRENQSETAITINRQITVRCSRSQIQRPGLDCSRVTPRMEAARGRQG